MTFAHGLAPSSSYATATHALRPEMTLEERQKADDAADKFVQQCQARKPPKPPKRHSHSREQPPTSQQVAEWCAIEQANCNQRLTEQDRERLRLEMERVQLEQERTAL